MRQEEALNGAVENNNLYVFVGSSAVTISFNSGIVSGPKIFKGGLSNVTRQYDEVRRARRICLATLLMFVSKIRITDCHLAMVRCGARLLRRIAECKPGQGMYVE
jgi:hypothetical protein